MRYVSFNISSLERKKNANTLNFIVVCVDLLRLCICTGSSEPSLLDNAVSIKISCAGSNTVQRAKVKDAGSRTMHYKNKCNFKPNLVAAELNILNDINAICKVVRKNSLDSDSTISAIFSSLYHFSKVISETGKS